MKETPVYDDFVGFQYGELHSSQFGLYRVSSSNRYEEQLIPQFSETKTAVPGGDGTYFFGANYTQKQIKISFVFDNLNEEDYRKMRAWLGVKDSFKKLIFDERPYKYYMAKPSAPPVLKTLCFTENYIEGNKTKTRRIYKGEGEIQFICYYPFAKTFEGIKYENKINSIPQMAINSSEWVSSVNWLESQGSFDKFAATTSTQTAYLYNPGDFTANYKITLAQIPQKIEMIHEDATTQTTTATLVNFTTSTLPFVSGITINAIQIDSKTNTIQAGTCTTSSSQIIQFTGVTLFNSAADIINLVTIPVDMSLPSNTSDAKTKIVITNSSNSGNIAKIEYDYLYL